MNFQKNSQKKEINIRNEKTFMNVFIGQMYKFDDQLKMKFTARWKPAAKLSAKGNCFSSQFCGSVSIFFFLPADIKHLKALRSEFAFNNVRIVPDSDLAEYPANLFAGYRKSA